MKLIISMVLLCYAWAALMWMIAICQAAKQRPTDLLTRAMDSGNLAVPSAPPDSRPAQPSLLAARNAPGARASLSNAECGMRNAELITLNPRLFLN